MIKLTNDGYGEVYSRYLKGEQFFPLIASVLLDAQEGVVYVNDLASPSQAYIEHAFGFSQIVGEPDASFERELERYLLVARAFEPPKIRLYAPYLPAFLSSPQCVSMRSNRQRFTISAEDFSLAGVGVNEASKKTAVSAVDSANVSQIEQAFGVVGRFWRSPVDFVQRSNAVAVFYEGMPAALCYSAAEADARVEIDVLTLQEYRRLGLGRLAVDHFLSRCFSLSLHPLWDCFTNNVESMNLCHSVGFTPQKAYPFFTIAR